jgi:GTP-binding protein
VFLDEIVLTVQSGKGGDGIAAFHREKFVPRGGPSGGDGGRGGDVVLRVEPQLSTFGDMEGERTVRAGDGGRGGGGKCHGADGEDVVVRVPAGTTVFDADTGDRLAELVKPGATFVAARGGRGGRGNARFATAEDQAPTRFTRGGRAFRRRLRLELRLLADVGLVGLPNAGKSTMLARLSNATPKVADYPFTTLEPYLGLVEARDFRRFVLADLPGLIEGAHAGKGLGDRFLRHVERTRVLLHLVDLFPPEGGDPVEAYRTVRRELRAYGRGLSRRKEVVAGTKADLGDEAAVAAAVRRLSRAVRRPVIAVSAATGRGLEALGRALVSALDAAGVA